MVVYNFYYNTESYDLFGLERCFLCCHALAEKMGV